MSDLTKNSLLANAPMVYPCPHCGEEVNTSFTECQYCHEPLDPTFAGEAASLEAKVSKAFSDGSMVRIAAGIGFAGACLLFRNWSLSRNLPGLSVYPLVSMVVPAIALIMGIRWSAKFSLLPFKRLGPVAAGKMQADWRKGRSAARQGLGIAGGTLVLAAVWLAFGL